MHRRHPVARIGLDEVGIVRVVVGMRQRSQVGAAFKVALRHARKVNRQHDVAGDEQEMLGQRIEQSQQRARAAERLMLHQYAGAEPEAGAIAEKGLDLVREMPRKHGDVAHAGGASELELVRQDRLAAHRDEHLRHVAGDGSKPRALAACENRKMRHRRGVALAGIQLRRRGARIHTCFPA